MRPVSARAGYTLIEIIVVIAVVSIIGAVLLPTLSGMRRDTRVKAGADIVRGSLSEARGKAIETGLNYRLAISSDGNRVRIAPDALDTQGQLPDAAGGTPTVREETLPDGVTIATTGEDAPAADANGWITVATILNDGTCREDLSEVKLSETGVQPILVRIRGLTGTAVLVNTAGGSRP